MMTTEMTDEIILAASYIRLKICLEGKSDLIDNQVINFIEKLFKEYPDQKHLRNLYRTTYDTLHSEPLSELKRLHLISILHHYLDIDISPEKKFTSEVIR